MKALGNSEVMAEMLGILLPVTLDSGAQVTIVPEEAVKESEFTGETTRFNGIMHGEYSGKLANIVLQIGGETFARTAVAVPGKDISWTATMSFNMKDMEEFKRLHHQLNLSSQLTEEDTHFLPPRMEEGTIRGAVRVSQGIVVEAESKPEVSVVTEPVGVEPEPQSEEAKVNDERAMVEECDVGSVNERSLVEEEENASVLEEVDVGAQGGSDDSGDEQVCVKDIVARETRENFAEELTKKDSTLATARTLADQTAEGYHWVEGLLFRTRLDTLGDNIEQLCLPTPYRARCLYH